MTERTTERRACERFVVGGATVHYKKEALFFPKDFTEDFYPVIDISRGGLRFVCGDFLDVDTKVALRIVIPGEETPLVMKGKVRWISPNPGKSYKYQLGIQFAPYGGKKGENQPEALKRLAVLEERFKGA